MKKSTITKAVQDFLITTTRTVESHDELQQALFVYLKDTVDLKNVLLNEVKHADQSFFDNVFRFAFMKLDGEQQEDILQMILQLNTPVSMKSLEDILKKKTDI